MALLLALAVSAAGCSASKPKPVIQTRYVKPVLPPACLREAPKLSEIPDRDMTQNEVHDKWDADRRSRNIAEIGREACVKAVNATQVP